MITSTIAHVQVELLRYRLPRPVGGSRVAIVDVMLFVHVAAAPGIAWLKAFPLAEPLFTGWPSLREDGTPGMREVAGPGLALADGARGEFQLALD